MCSSDLKNLFCGRYIHVPIHSVSSTHRQRHTHTYIYACMHTQIRRVSFPVDRHVLFRSKKSMLWQIYTCTHSLCLFHTQTKTHTHIYIRMHAHTNKKGVFSVCLTYTHTHITQMHIRITARAHTHTNTQTL